MLLTLLQFFATKFLFLALHLESGCFPRPLTAREEAAAFSALRAGDAAAREKLIRHNLRLVAHIVKKYYALPGDQEDLVSIGTIGLMKAVDTFDATRKARFSTYASRCIENEIRMQFRRERKNGQTVSLQEALEADGDSALTLADVIQDGFCMEDSCERQEDVRRLRQLLDTLPSAILRDGCAEALKTALLFDPDLFSHLAARGTDFDRMTVLPRCIACKRDAVCADEFDRGARQLLNLGHTAGHAIEALSGYRIAHGHAVAIGLAIMARAFCRDAAEIEAALTRLGLPTRTEFSPERLAQAALADKKRTGERITLVIPRAIGDCVLREVPVDTLADIFERGM